MQVSTTIDSHRNISPHYSSRVGIGVCLSWLMKQADFLVAIDGGSCDWWCIVQFLIIDFWNTPIIHVWSPPSARVYKINSDAACFNDKSTSLGGVMRDQTGDIMAATCWLVQGCFDIDIAEALAATHALLIAMEAGLKRVILEVDNLKLFKHLSKGSYDSSCFGLVVKDIVYLACLCLSCSFSHVGRNGNRVAHILANCGRAFDEMRLIVNFFFSFLRFESLFVQFPVKSTRKIVIPIPLN
ncbi:uncharacterized protein LOC110735405 [Chenopodium quinoa]|uniref:uncharacterized protein LOC110735405 n=1 Tax=Chenopodium quinoa TaxID=63459 RepID=UPI000B77085F|nr:uncharacterized protein LOC110735405 [Chenopodium quinoa]